MEEQKIIQGILDDNNQTIMFIYRKYYPKIKSMVLSFHNLVLDPEDIFQEGLTRAIINIKHNRFAGKSSFFTYLFAICRNICLNELKKSITYSNEFTDSNEENGDANYFETIEIVLRIKTQLDEICNKILDMRFQLPSREKTTSNPDRKMMKFEEIGVQLNMNADNVRQRFRRCLEKLKQMLLEHPQCV